MRWILTITFVFFSCNAFLCHAGNAKTGSIELHVHAGGFTKQPLPCRVHLHNAKGKPQRIGNLPFWRDHFVCSGRVKATLPPGEYSYEVERGPEYYTATGKFRIGAGRTIKREVRLKRLTELSKEGWWSGELHVHRAPEDMELLMQSDDLFVAPVITWWNNRNLWKGRKLPKELLVRFDKHRRYQLMAGEDERQGGALLYFGLKQPLNITGSTREYPSPMRFADLAHKAHAGVWIDIEKPFWWDVPIWLALGIADSIGLANNHMCRSRMYESEAWGKPRNVKRLPPPRGNGYWTQEIYYHILNSGIRIPPSAGSASGVLPNPVGYNRAYVYLGKNFSYKNWFEGLRAGRVFVTNGPLLRVKGEGHWPGHVFKGKANERTKINLTARLDAKDKIRVVEIIKNGKVHRAVPFEELKKSGSLGSLFFDKSGWFLVRAIADNKKTFRFASTGPYYVEIGEEKNRISKRSAQFFLDWVNERINLVREPDSKRRAEVLQYHEKAKRFWQKRVQNANAP